MKHVFSLVFAASLAIAVVPVAAAPVQLVSRAEAVKFIVSQSPLMAKRLAEFHKRMPPLPLFLDVPQQNQLAPYLEVAFEQGVIVGNADRAFRPTDPISVEELTVLNARAVAVGDVQAAAGLASPAAGEPWYARAEAVLASRGMESPKNLGTGAFANRNSFAFMGSQLAAFLSQHTVVASMPTVPSPAPQPPASSVSSASSAGVPQYLPVRLQPLPVMASSSSASAQVNAALSAVQVANAQQSPVIVASQQGASINAGQQPQQGGNFIDVVTTPQPVTINAGGGDTVPASTDDFTITIPRLGIGPITVTSPEDPFSHSGLLAPLQQGLGHLFGNPGGGGKILVYGHSSSYPWDTSAFTKIFRRINELNPGDEVLITFGGQQYRYEVTFEETVPAKDMSAYQDDGTGEDLILYTCWPPDSISQRYLVHAKPV